MKVRCHGVQGFYLCLVAIWFSVLTFSASAQQLSPQEQAMGQIINALQTGTENWGRYTPALQQIIRAQTGNTGVYVALAQLGSPTAIHMTQVIQLPAGHYYIFRTEFNAGALDWQVVADLYGNIWGLTFQPVVSQTQNRGSGDDDSKPTPTTDLPTGGKKKVDKPKSVDEACQLYPNLC